MSPRIPPARAAGPQLCFYNFEEGSGTTVYDSSGNGYDGTILVSGSAPSYSTDVPAGGGNYSLYFDGNGGYVNAGSPSGEINGNHSFTVSFWMKYQPIASRQWVLFIGSSGTYQGVHWLIQANGMTQFGFWGVSGAQNSFNISAYQNEWVHVTTTYDATTRILTTYLNGAQVASNGVAGTPAVASSRAYIGDKGVNLAGESSYKGWLDNVEIRDDVKPPVVFAVTATSNMPGGNSPAADWRFEEGSGDTASDLSGNDNIGTLSDPAMWSAGRFGGGLTMDGSNWVEVPDSPALDISDAITVAAWIKLAGIPTSPGMAVIEKADTDADASYMIYVLSSGKVRPHIFGSTWRYADIPVVLSPNVWYHIAYTYDAATGAMKGYVNGAEYVLNSGAQPGETIRASTAPLLIGKDTRDVTNVVSYDGDIDEVQIYNRVLSQAEISRLAWGDAGYSGISCDSPVFSGVNSTCKVTPPEGYHLKALTDNGSDVTAEVSGNTYAINNVSADHMVNAEFEINTYTVSSSAGEGGSIDPSTNQTFNYGTTTSFTVTPDAGYGIASVTGCGGTLSGDTYTTGPLTAGCTVSATFAILPTPNFTWQNDSTTSYRVNVNAVNSVCPAGATCSYSWDFGDGSAQENGVATGHTYTGSGPRDVVLTVSTSEGVSSSITKVVTPVPVHQRFECGGGLGSMSAGEVGEIITFTDNTVIPVDNGGTGTSYINWDDGSPLSVGAAGGAAGTDFTHKYIWPGNYTITQIVQDDMGFTCTQKYGITISNPGEQDKGTLTISADSSAFTISYYVKGADSWGNMYTEASGSLNVPPAGDSVTLTLSPGSYDVYIYFSSGHTCSSWTQPTPATVTNGGDTQLNLTGCK